MTKSRVIFTVLIVSLALLTVPRRALAHGEPEIAVTPDTVAAGGTITITGAQMGANEGFKIFVEGENFTAELGEATSDANEKFELQFTIPANAPEGTYNVKAAGEDGHTVTAEMTVTAASNTMPSEAAHQLPRSRTPGEVAGLFALAVLSAALGLVLVRQK